jgi:tetratricopeptide (TPR) repeat protein
MNRELYQGLIGLNLVVAVLAGSIHAQNPPAVDQDKTIQQLSAKINANDSDVMALMERGKIYLGQKQYEAAIKDFNRAVQLEPREPRAFLLRGIAYRELAFKIDPFDALSDLLLDAPNSEGSRQSLLKSAFDDFGQALELPYRGSQKESTTFWANVYVERGIAWEPTDLFLAKSAPDTLAILSDGSDISKAVQDYTSAIGLEAQHFEARLRRGLCYALNDATRKNALADLSIAVAAAPNSIRALLARAELHSSMGNTDDALADATKALGIDGDSEPAQRLRMDLFLKRKEFDKAMADANRMIDFNPNSELGWQFKHEIFLSQEKFTDALESLNNVIDIQISQMRKPDIARNSRGHLLLQLGRIDEALHDFYWVAISGEFPLNGIAQDQLKKMELPLPSTDRQRIAMVQSMTKKLELNPNDHKTRLTRAIALASLKHVPMAKDEFDALIKINPRAALLFYHRGNLLRDLKRLPEAIADYSRAIELDNSRGVVFKERGIAYQYSGKHKEAIDDFDRAAALLGGDEKAIGELEGLRKESEGALDGALDTEKAQELFNAADAFDFKSLPFGYRDLIPPPLDVERPNRFAKSLIVAGEYEKAIEALDQERLGLLDAEGFRLRGKANEALGRFTEAMRDYQHSAELAPQNSEIKALIESLEMKMKSQKSSPVPK